MRLFRSMPWQAKQFSERMGSTSRLKSTGVAGEGQGAAAAAVPSISGTSRAAAVRLPGVETPVCTYETRLRGLGVSRPLLAGFLIVGVSSGAIDGLIWSP